MWRVYGTAAAAAAWCIITLPRPALAVTCKLAIVNGLLLLVPGALYICRAPLGCYMQAGHGEWGGQDGWPTYGMV